MEKLILIILMALGAANSMQAAVTPTPTPLPDGCLEQTLVFISQKGSINPIYAPTPPYPAAPPVDSMGRSWLDSEYDASTWALAQCQCGNGLTFFMPADILRPPGTYCESVPSLPWPYAGGGTNFADWYGPVYFNVPSGAIWWTRRVIDLPQDVTFHAATLEYTADNFSDAYFNGNLVHSITDQNEYKFNHVVSLMPYITPGVTRYVFASEVGNVSSASGITYKIKFKYCLWATPTPDTRPKIEPGKVKVCPNPVVDQKAHFVLDLDQSCRVVILIYNTAGKQVGRAEAMAGPEDPYVNVGVKGLAKGLYYHVVEIQQADGSFKRLGPGKMYKK
jgi:hypothetical protein